MYWPVLTDKQCLKCYACEILRGILVINHRSEEIMQRASSAHILTFFFAACVCFTSKGIVRASMHLRCPQPPLNIKT